MTVRSTRSTPAAPVNGEASSPAGDSLAVDLRQVDFQYPTGEKVLEQIDLTVGRGEIIVLIGASGCGKSTMLNLIAGMIKPVSGEVHSCGKPVTTLNQHVSYMTQRDTLLAWRTAIDNVALPLEIKRVPKRERHERARQAIERVGIAPRALTLKPHQLSGGMRSRLALGRLLLSESDIVLMDEPFAAVDALLRMRLQRLLLEVWQETNKTIIYVTHDLDEAITLGQRVIVMSRHPGRVALEKVIPFEQPRDVARFRASPEARQIYVELFDALERTMS